MAWTNVVGAAASENTLTKTTAAITLVEAAAWTNVVGATASGNTLTKTAALGWGNAGAVSTRQLASGDGFVEFGASGALMAGLGNGDTNQSYADVEYAVFLDLASTIHVYEAGILKATFGTYSPGDRLRVGIEGGVVKYRRNGTLFYTSQVSPAGMYPLRLDTALYSASSQILSAAIQGTLVP